ncbi:unnamed protein product [Laminaria digitata]
MHKGDSVNAAILHAIFGDGCAVAVVGGLTASTAKPGSLAVLDNQSWLVDGTEDGIQMSFGNNGVSCKLSKRLPDYVKTNVSDFVDEVRVLLGRRRHLPPPPRSLMHALLLSKTSPPCVRFCR